MSPRAVSALVDLAIWGLPLYLLCAAVVSRVGERRRRRAVAAARVVTPPVQQSNVSVRHPDMTDDQLARLMDDWSTPEQRRPAS